ncbi:MAG: DUF560 domain-containing protein [Alphaproteobacteria bacterium]|nr:DUF560 domain-containing protein [Alphaproteobacteria bacterium]
MLKRRLIRAILYCTAGLMCVGASVDAAEVSQATADAATESGGTAEYKRGMAALDENRFGDGIKHLLIAIRRGIPKAEQNRAEFILLFMEKKEPQAFQAGKEAAILELKPRQPALLDISRPFSTKPFELSGFAGIEFVDGIATSRMKNDATATPLRSSDFRYRLDTSVAYPFAPFGGSVKGKIGYDLSVTEYTDYTAYRFHGHTGLLAFEGPVGPETQWDVSGDATQYFSGSPITGYASVFRGGAGISHDFSQILGDKVLVRLAIDLSRTDYDRGSELDGNKPEVSVNAVWVPKFLDGKWSFVAGAAEGRSHASRDQNQYNFRSGHLGAGWQFDPIQKINISAGIASNVYDALDSTQTTVKRKDTITALSLSYQYRLMEWMDLVAGLSVMNSDSTLSRQDYMSKVVSFGTSVRF